MQPRITPVRSTFTATQIDALIKTDDGITFGMGMELLDRDLNIIADISDSLRECTVTRDSTAVLHGSCDFSLSQKLSWGRAVVRPYATISNGTIKARFDQGAYFTSTPATVTDSSPTTYAVQGVDILNSLNTLVGDSYALNVGDSYLTAVENILLNQGYTQYTIDPARQDTLAPSAKGWPIDESTTWLTIVNELLAAVGYRSIYSDWYGRLICEALVDVMSAAPEWTYDRGQYTSQMVPGQIITHDYFATPNRWVGIQGSNSDTAAVPVEGAGVFTYVNNNDGETSVVERDQVITRVLTITAADQAALVAAVMSAVSTDKIVGTIIEAQTSGNPLHWHLDVVSVETLELGVVRMRDTRWSMNLLTGAMQHSWAKL